MRQRFRILIAFILFLNCGNSALSQSDSDPNVIYPPAEIEAGEIVFCFEADDEIRSTPAIGEDGTIYFGSLNATFYAVDCNGNLKWEWIYDCPYDGWCPQAFEGSPAIGDDGTIYVADDIGIPNFLFALFPDGEKKWEYETVVVYGAMDASPVLLSDGTIFAGAHGFSGWSGLVGQLVALTPDGTVLDGFPLYTKAIYNSPVAVDDVVVVGEGGLSYSRIFAVNKNAEILWETELNIHNNHYWNASLSSLAVDHEKNILVAQNFIGGSSNFMKSAIFQFDSTNGEKIFEMEVSEQSKVVGSPVIDTAEHGANVIVVTQDAHVVSLNPYVDGEKLNFDLVLDENSEAVGTPVIGDNGMLYHAVNRISDANQIDVFEINTDGTINDDFVITIMNEQVSSSLTMDNNGVIYFGTKGGELYAVQTGAGGLSSDAPWPTFRHDIRNTGNSELRPWKESTQAGEILFCFEADGEIVSTPSIADDGTIYFGTQNATLFAVEPNGNPRWEWKYEYGEWGGPQAFESSPVIGEDGTIYVADDIAIPNYFFALSPEGEKKWVYMTSIVYGAMDASPVLLTDGTIFAGAHGFSLPGGVLGQLVALAPDGTVLDGFPVDTGAIYASPVAVDDVVVVAQKGNGFNKVFAVNKNAEILWKTEFHNFRSTDRPVSLSSLAVDHEKNILVAWNFPSEHLRTTYSTIFQLDPTNGEKLFEMTIPTKSVVVGSPVIDIAVQGANVIVATENGYVVSLNPYVNGGTLNYELDLGENCEAVGTPVIGDNNKLYHAVNSFRDTNQIDVFEINADGTISDDFVVTILNDQVSSSLAMDNNGVIYFGTKGGKLYAVQTDADGLSREAPWPTFRHDIRNTGNSGL